jgi:MSHA pilin protein MshD
MSIKQHSAHGRVAPSDLKVSSLNYARGTTLIELIVFIVIVSAALAGILKVMTLTTGHSSDTLLRKQSLAIATSLLEEIELMPFTYCDPTDVNAASAVSTAGCTAGLSQDVITGPTPSTATRSSVTAPFNNVADYSNYQMSPSLTNGIVDVTGTVVAGLNSYSASVAISRAGTSFLGAADNSAALQITVTVTAPDGNKVVLDGYRARYAPNSF